MPITIGSNLASLTAQRRLSENTSQLSKTYERLSSGQRINRAADDAAGLAISESLKSDRRVFNQGVRNFNDGISLLNIADGAIENLSNIVIRLKELAEQSANGTYSTTQRAAIDKEAQALSKEYTRIVHSTKFNGVHLLNGSLGNGVRLQGGYGAEGGIFSGIGGAIGDGTFNSSISIGAVTTPFSVTSGDFNGDGLLDIATADTTTSTVSMLLGNGNGTFKARVSYSLGAGADPYSLTNADLNGDGLLDIVTSNITTGNASVLLGRGDGTFSASQSYSLGSVVSVPYAITTGDLNGDGIIDLISANSGTNSVGILIGKGNGTFASVITYSSNGLSTQAVSTGDFNGDGILDIIAANYSSDSLSLLIGRGDGTFGAGSFLNVGDGPTSILNGDLNGDGKLDVVTVDSISETISILIGRGDGTFSSRVSYSTGSGSTPYNVSSGDFNGDGILDLVTADNGTGTTSIFTGRGDGTLNSRVSYTAGAGAGSVLNGDFNGDGVLDLVTANYGANSVSILTGKSIEGTSPLLPFDLKTLSGARQALPAFDQKIQQLGKQRGQIGAFQSRVQVGINNLQSASENYAAAESRIKDADIAAESAQLVRLNILQQAASSVLGQANLQPQLALRLLGGGR